MDRSGRKGIDATGETVSTGGLEKNLGVAPDLVLGAMVGEYRVDGILGEGGMGKVYSALHPVIAKRAAIKVLHPELSMNKEAVDRFVQEARAVNQIGHPNIVDIFAFGTMPDGRCYFVMEQLRGESLRERLRRPPALALADGLSILDTITVALDAAHEKGIVHRDLKPDNVFLVNVKSDRPQVKLLDFGIAKLLGNDGRVAEKTRTGNLMGTPAYMSPEQARGYSVDHRTDVYALGAMAFELATGRLPFPFDNAADMIAAHLFQPPPSVRSINPHVSPQLDSLIQRLLAKDPAHRPSLAQARDELRTCRGQLAYGVLAGQHLDAQGAPTDPIPGGYPTPMGATPTPGPQVTPYAKGYPTPQYPQPTPAYGQPTQYAQQPTPHSFAPAPAKKRWPIVVAVAVAVVGGVVAIAVVNGSGKPASSAQQEPATEPAAAPTPAAAASPTPTPTPAPTPAPAAAPTPAPVAAPTPPPVEPAPPAVAEGSGSAAKATTPKKRATTKRKSTTKTTTPDDDDAAM